MDAALLLLTPDEDRDGRWRLRLFPWPQAFPVPALNAGGEVLGAPLPDFCELDRWMLEARAGYTKRVHASGVMEISATGRAIEPLCRWLAETLKEPRDEG